MPPWTETATGLVLTVRVTPKASRTEAAGVIVLPDGRPTLAVRLAAPPVDGAANAELVSFVAKALGLRKSAVTILAGDASRLKRLALDGDVAELSRKLDALICSSPAPR